MQFSSVAYETRLLLDDPLEVTANYELYKFGAGMIGRHTHSPSIRFRDRPTSPSKETEVVVVRMHVSGRTSGVMDGQSFVSDNTKISIFNFDQSIRAKYEDVEILTFGIPYSAIGYDPSRHPAVMDISRKSVIGKMIERNLTHAFEQAQRIDPEDAEVLSSGISGLLQGLLTQNFRDESAYRKFKIAKETSARSYIKANLKHADLNADVICKEVGISRPALYRLFETEGGVGKAITQMRLEGAFEELCRSVPARGAVANVARNWSFHDQAHFTRLFRGCFGFRPSDALGSDHAEGGQYYNGATHELPVRQSSDVQLMDVYGPNTR